MKEIVPNQPTNLSGSLIVLDLNNVSRLAKGQIP